MHYSVSSYINNSVVKRKSNIFMEKIIGLFFRKVDFDSESLTTIQDCSNRGSVVYVSYQSTVTSLLILNNLLKKHNLTAPYLALDFKPYVLQVFSNFFKRFFRFLTKIFSRKKLEKISDNEYLEYIIQDNRTFILSLLSRKLFKRRYLDIESDNIQFLIEIQKKIDTPIFILPKLMFWNRNPERTRGLLGARATGDRSMISAIISNVRSATPAFVRVSEPINLKEEMENYSVTESREIARHLRNKLLEGYNHEKRSILGPVIKSQQEMIEKVLYHNNTLDTIKGLIVDEKASEKKLRKKAYKYYKEIAADFSIIYIKLFEKTLNYIFNKIFDGISYDIEDFRKIREAAKEWSSYSNAES